MAKPIVAIVGRPNVGKSTIFNKLTGQRLAIVEGLAEMGKVKTVIVKDMSRMGRDYLKVGYYTESFFAERDIRYIAINDGVDSDKGDNDFTPFRNLFNDFYARDTSKKIRAVMRAKGNSGEHLCTNPPYGYRKDPEDKKRWIVDEEAAEVVK